MPAATAPAAAPDRGALQRIAGVPPHLLALAVLVAAGAAIRFATLGDRSFWIDEVYTIQVVRHPFGGMLHHWRVHEGTPPLYYVLAWCWTRAFGTGEVGLRSLSALFGTATIPVAYAVAARLATRRAGLVAALLVSVSAMDVWFSQDGRAYVLAVLTGGLSFWMFLLAREAPTPRRLAAWAGASTLAVASHYFAPFLVAAEGLWLLAAHRGRRRSILLAAGVAGAAFAALIPIAISQNTKISPGSKGFIAGVSHLSRLAQMPAQYVVGFQPPKQVLVSVLAFLAVPVAVWLLVARTDGRERMGAVVAGTIGVAGALGPALISFVPGLDLFITRHTAFAFVPVVTAIAIGLGARRAGAAGALALVWLCGFMLAVDFLTADKPKFDHSDWKGAAHALGPAWSGRVLVVTPDDGGIVLPFYLRGAKSTFVPRTTAEVDVIALPPPIRRIGHDPTPPRAASPRPLAGFVLTERRDAHTFTLLRYRASRPRSVDPFTLRALALEVRYGVALVNVPGRSPKP